MSAFRKELYLEVRIATGNASNLLEDLTREKRIIDRAEEERCDANSREKSNGARTRVIIICVGKAMRLLRRVFPVCQDYRESRFLVRDAGRWMLTPLAVSLVLVETTDLIFAVDSIPAIFAITTDPFIVFTSNVFAILGLRSLYFALSSAIAKFRYLKVSLAAILGLVGLKMLAAEWLKDVIGPSFNFYLLGIVAVILGVGVLASVIMTRREDRQAEPAK